MRTDDRVGSWIRRSLAVATAIVVLARPLAADAAGSGSGDSVLEILQVTRDNRVTMTTAPAHLARAVSVGGFPTAPTVDMRGVLGRAIVAYAFHLELMDSAGAPFAGRAAVWTGEATLYAGPRTLVQLGTRNLDASLPKPLGFLLAAGDTLRIVAFMEPTAPTASDAIRLRLVIDCEPADKPVSRLAVTMVELSRSTLDSADPADEDRGIDSWTWTSELGGRALALTGTALNDAIELSLTDVTTGDLLWRDLGPANRPGYTGPHCVRIGASLLRRDHVYRIMIRYARTTARDASRDDGTLRIIVLPAPPLDRR